MTKFPFFASGAFPFESAWGILMNFAIFNGCSVKMAMSGVGLDDARLNFYCYEKSGGSGRLPGSVVCRSSDHYPSSYDLDRFEHKFCPECAQMGYHSVFFFFPSVGTCLVHARPLVKCCESCARIFLDANTSLEDGYVCDACGFSFPSAFLQLPFRKDPQVKMHLAKAGLGQKKWFRALSDCSEAGNRLCARMLEAISADFDEDLSSAAIQIAGVKNPFHAGAAPRSADVEVLHWTSAAAVVSQLSRSGLDDLNDTLEKACGIIERRYLSGHAECLAQVQRLMAYAAEERYVYPVCLPALAYALFRVRLGYKGGWDGSCDDLKMAGFDYVKSCARGRLWITGVSEEFFIGFYLKILGSIKRILDGPESQYLALGAAGGLFDEMMDGYSTKTSSGTAFARVFYPEELECRARQLYVNAFEAERLLVKAPGSRVYLLLNTTYSERSIGRLDI